MMTRKDFIQLAGTTAKMIRQLRKADTPAEDIILNEIMSFCRSQNYKFDDGRFKAKVEELLK